MASAGEYSDDAKRIKRDYTDAEDVTEDELREALRDADFADAAIDEIMGDGWFPTADEVSEAVGEPHSDGITTREDVGDAVDAVDEVGYGDDTHDALTDAVSREVGAPSEQEAQRASIEAVSDTVTPGEVIEGDERSTPVSVVRNTDGETIGTVGGNAADDVADELGVRSFGDVNEFSSSLSVRPAPGGNEGLVYAGDEAVGEVDL